MKQATALQTFARGSFHCNKKGVVNLGSKQSLEFWIPQSQAYVPLHLSTSLCLPNHMNNGTLISPKCALTKGEDVLIDLVQRRAAAHAAVPLLLIVIPIHRAHRCKVLAVSHHSASRDGWINLLVSIITRRRAHDIHMHIHIHMHACIACMHVHTYICTCVCLH